MRVDGGAKILQALHAHKLHHMMKVEKYNFTLQSYQMVYESTLTFFYFTVVTCNVTNNGEYYNVYFFLLMEKAK